MADGSSSLVTCHFNRMTATGHFDPAVRIKLATESDIARMIPVVSAAFAIETFLDGSRTDEQRMREMIQKGEFLLAEDDSGRLLGCVYLERRAASADTSACWRLIHRSRARVSDD